MYNNDILQGYGGVDGNFLGNILEECNSTNTNITMENILSPSPYIDMSDIINSFNKFNLKYLSLNIRSLNANIEKLKNTLNHLENNNCFIDIIAIQETWLNNINTHMKSLQIPGYELFLSHCRLTSHSGVAFYVKSDLKVVQIDTGQFNSFEHIGLRLEHSDKAITLFNIYRPPSIQNIDIFNNDMEQFLDKINMENSCIISGDFNVNLLEVQENKNTYEFLSHQFCHGFQPTVTLPTRIFGNKASLIDNIFQKVPNHISTKSAILISDISDHFPQLMGINMHSKLKENKHIYIRKSGPSQFEHFQLKLHEAQLDCKIDQSNEANPHTNYTIINEHLCRLSEECFPIKQVRFNRKTHFINPWMTSSLLNSINTKNKLFKLTKTTNHNSARYKDVVEQYKAFDLTLKKVLRFAKKEYFAQYFQQNKYNMIKTWKKIKELISNGNCSGCQNEFIHNNNIIKDPKQIAITFNNFFATVGQKYSDAIPKLTGTSFSDYLGPRTENCMDFQKLSVQQVCEIVKNLKNKDSCGHDGISVKLLKHIFPIIANTITTVLNQCLQANTFPDQLKIAKIAPIFKTGEKNKFENYRPISILPAVSKVFEKAMANQLVDHLKTNNILYRSQYAYRQNHNTELAAAEFIDKVVNDLDNKASPLAIYIDLSKAFDTINHTILLDKLEHYGIRNGALDLFRSYLHNRRQYVAYNNSTSNMVDISIGVPQGSILGPILFTIYMNDFVNSSSTFDFILYADDTTLYTDVKKVNEQSINVELQKIVKWLNVNKLSINAKKTKMMLFHISKKPKSPQVKLNGVVVEDVSHFKFLGIMIANNLSWTAHLMYLANKLAKATFILNKLKNFLPINILKILYFSLFHCHLNYGIIIWGHVLNDTDLISKRQKRVIRIISNSPYNAHTSAIFKHLNITKVADQYLCAKYTFLYKLDNNMLPGYFLENFKFIRNHDLHDHNTRNNLVRIPTVNNSKKLAKTYLRIELSILVNEGKGAILAKIRTHSLNGYKLYIKRSIIDSYHETCTLTNCYICNKNT